MNQCVHLVPLAFRLVLTTEVTLCIMYSDEGVQKRVIANSISVWVPGDDLHIGFVLGVSILPLSTTLILDFGTVPTVWYFLSSVLLFPHQRSCEGI